DALKWLALPRTLGTHPELGENVLANVGRYGPYVQCGKEFRSLEDSDDVYTVELDRALYLLSQPKRSRGRGAAKKVLKELGKHPESGVNIQVLDGRYGPYVTDGTTHASLPKTKAPVDLTLEEAVVMIAERAKTAGTKKKK